MGMCKPGKGGVDILKARRLVIILAIIAAFILVLFLWIAGALTLSSLFILPQGSADITGNSVDNNYNNILAGSNLVRINNKLYYNFERNAQNYGLIEISKDGSRRIYWEGIMLHAPRLSYPIRMHNGSLTMELENGIKHYVADTNAFEEYKPFNTIPEISLYFQETDLGLFYESKVEPGQFGNLCVYDGNSTKVIAEEIESFYADCCDIYYYTLTSPTGQSGEFRKYCMVDKTDVSICELNNYRCVFSFMLEKNYLIFEGVNLNEGNDTEFSVYKINLSNADKKPELVCRGNAIVSYAYNQYDINSMNVYNGTIYVASCSGLTAFDVSSNDKRKLYNHYVEECYIVDDTWIYFVDRNARLLRIPQTGGNAELVYG